MQALQAVWGRLALPLDSAARAFTWTTCAVYVFSFSSAYTQIAGLHGPGVSATYRTIHESPVVWLRCTLPGV